MDHPVVPLGSRHFSLRTMGLFSRLLASLRLLLHLKTPLEGSDAPSRTTGAPDQSELFPLEIGQSPSIDPGPLCEHLVGLVRHLRSPLLASCEWLERGALEFVGGRPIDAGGVADIWIGEMDNRNQGLQMLFIFKQLSDIRGKWRLPLACGFTKGPSVEVLQRSTGM